MYIDIYIYIHNIESYTLAAGKFSHFEPWQMASRDVLWWTVWRD